MGREVRRGISCEEGEGVKGNRKYRKGRDESLPIYCTEEATVPIMIQCPYSCVLNLPRSFFHKRFYHL